MAHVEASGASTPDEREQYNRLTEWFRDWDEVIVAFSGGVDSTLVLQAACDGAGASRVLAVTASSPSLPASELEESKLLAKKIGVRQRILETLELDNPAYQANRGDRCFHCKSTMYQSVMEVLRQKVSSEIPQRRALVDGTNFDDLQDIRPGHKAARAAGVLHPLLELKLGKEAVRRLSNVRGLQTWDKPEMACLASRIPAGVSVTREKLALVESSEAALRQLGFRSFRVRYHELRSLRDNNSKLGPLTLARLEFSEEEVERATRVDVRRQISTTLQARGFSFVTIDLDGYRKGGVPRGNQ